MEAQVAYVQTRDRAVSAYKQYSVGTASPAELVALLYNACIREIKDAIEAIGQKNIPLSHKKLVRAQDIVDELLASLNPEAGEIAERLSALYAFVNNSLVEANLKKDVRPAQNALRVMTELRDAWTEAARKA